MPGVGLEKKLLELLEIKDKHDLDNEQFLLLIGLTNLMGIVNLLEARAAGGARRSGTGRPQELVPFLGMFGAPKFRPPADGAAK